MKHQYADLLARLMDEAGITPSGREDLLLRHLLWVIDTNRRVNLTAITSVEEGLRLHVIDSLTGLEELGDSCAGVMLDLGTGGGFPGIPLGVVSGRPTVLLDSVEKKVRALTEFITAERLDAFSAHASRAEEYANSNRGNASVVIGRAVAPLAALVELASPLLRLGGSFIAMKAPLSEDEYESGSVAAEIVGLDLVSRRFLSLPRGEEAREILHYRLEREPSVSLPRRVGVAQKRPLRRSASA